LECTGVGDVSQKEAALRLWEVHNSVNVRLVHEAAERERRIVSKEETIASKFPTKGMCPKCWLDGDMEVWDPAEVFNFLQQWYWPSDGSRSASSIDVHRRNSVEGTPISSRVGICLILVPICFFVCIFGNKSARNTKEVSSRKNR